MIINYEYLIDVYVSCADCEISDMKIATSFVLHILGVDINLKLSVHVSY